MKNISSIKDLRKYRKVLYNVANSKSAKYGQGFSALRKIILSPLTLLGLALGIAVSVIRITKGHDIILSIGFGLAIILFAFLIKLTDFFTALMAGFLTYDLSIALSNGVLFFTGGKNAPDLNFLLAVCITNLFLIAIFIFSIRIREKNKEKPHYISVADGDTVFFTENAAMNLLPLSFTTQLSEITLPLFATDRECFAAATSVNKKIYYANALLISFKIQNSIKKEITLYVLSDGSGNAENEVKKAYPDCTCTVFTENIWDILKERGLPEESKFFEIFNEKMYYELQKKGIDDAEEHTLLYSFLFKTEEKISDFLKEVEKEEYTPFVSEDNRLYSKITDANDSFIVVVKKKTRIGIQRLHSNTQYLFPIAKAFDAKFNGWIIADI